MSGTSAYLATVGLRSPRSGTGTDATPPRPGVADERDPAAARGAWTGLPPPRLVLIGSRDAHLKLAGLENADHAVDLGIEGLELLDDLLLLGAGVGDLGVGGGVQGGRAEPLAGEDQALEDHD